MGETVEEFYRRTKVKVDFFFDVNSVRALPMRPKYERCIEQAAWTGAKKCEIAYESRKVCSGVRDRLHNLGFTVGPIHSRNYGSDYWFYVSW